MRKVYPNTGESGKFRKVFFLPLSFELRCFQNHSVLLVYLPTSHSRYELENIFLSFRSDLFQQGARIEDIRNPC